MLDWPHLHVAFNHVAIVGFPFLAVLVAVAWLRRSRELLLTGVVLTILLGPATLLTKASGERAEEAVENLAWFKEAVVHDHEERAELAAIVAMAAAVVALGVGWWQRSRVELARGPAALLLVALLAVSTLLALTALSGGAIRHDEFGSTPAAGQERPDDDRDER